MWLSDTQSTLRPPPQKLLSMLTSLGFLAGRYARLAHSCFFLAPLLSVEIGVGLTAFGLFFMLMGVLMFFDGGLLAIGNVRRWTTASSEE